MAVCCVILTASLHTFFAREWKWRGLVYHRWTFVNEQMCPTSDKVRTHTGHSNTYVTYEIEGRLQGSHLHGRMGTLFRHISTGPRATTAKGKQECDRFSVR
jgi:hypothetical protein